MTLFPLPGVEPAHTKTADSAGDRGKLQGGQDRVDQTAGGATEAEDGADQEGDDAAERQARRPESQRCEPDSNARETRKGEDSV